MRYEPNSRDALRELVEMREQVLGDAMSDELAPYWVMMKYGRPFGAMQAIALIVADVPHPVGHAVKLSGVWHAVNFHGGDLFHAYGIEVTGKTLSDIKLALPDAERIAHIGIRSQRRREAAKREELRTPATNFRDTTPS